MTFPRVRDRFIRLLGVIFLIASLSLLAQAPVSFGPAGLLPAERHLRAPRRYFLARQRQWSAPGRGRAQGGMILVEATEARAYAPFIHVESAKLAVLTGRAHPPARATRGAPAH